MPLSVSELHPALHDLFHDTADELARDAEFCQRRRLLTGSVFARALVFTLLHNPDATLADLADTAADELAADVSPQAFDHRFSPQAGAFLRDLVAAAFDRAFDSARPALLPFLRRFNGVYVRDGSTVGLPPSLNRLAPGSGGSSPAAGAAAVKLVFEMEVTSGRLTELSVLAGKDNEKSADVSSNPLPEGALVLEDMGFLSAPRLQEYARQGVYFLTRVPAWSAFFDRRGVRVDLVKVLDKARGWYVEKDVRVFHKGKVGVRLMAVRVPQAEADERRRRVRREAADHRRPVSRRKLELCDWSILVTNAPADRISVYDAGAVRRVRWQIELVFKVFKSEAGIDRTRSKCRWRVLCEVYAKLLGVLVQQWVVLAAGYVMLVHSGRRASRYVRKQALELLRAIDGVEELGRVVSRLARQLERRCRIDRRPNRPTTLDRLAAIDREWDEDELLQAA